MLIKNKTKQALKDGKAAIGVFVCQPSFDIAELYSKIGFDWELFDMEHGSIGFDVLPWLLASASGDSTPLVRVPWNDPTYAKLALDAGAQGIMFPQVNSKEEAEKAVKACKYPPKGIRGVGPRRPSLYYTKLQEYMKVADEETMVIVQIETRDAVKRIDEILSVEGVDAAFIGPADLSVSMGYLTSFPKLEEEVLNAISRVLDSCRENNVAPGIWGGSVERVNQFLKEGFKFIGLGEDMDYLARAKEDLEKIKR
ncbi:MAG: aldolase/citrate lyase family protein [Candidatus Bathyarchaeia archaeon]